MTVETAPHTPADDVIVAPNGQLFLAGGRHSVLRFARGEIKVAPHSIEAMQANLAGRRSHADARGIAYLHLVAPEKYKILPDGFPVADPQSPADPYLAAGLTFCYPVDELRAGPGCAYFRTDTHWAPAGLITIARIIGQAAKTDQARLEGAEGEMRAALEDSPEIFYGDLGRKLDPKEGELRALLKPAHPIRMTENGIGHDYLSPVNDGRMIVVESDHPQASGRLLIFGDSYLHHALPYLSFLFSVIVFCRTRFYHEEMVDMVRPDCVVTQAADRYMGAIHRDTQAPPFQMIPFLLGRIPQCEPEAARTIAKHLAGGRTLNFAPFTSPAPKPPAAPSTNPQ